MSSVAELSIVYNERASTLNLLSSKKKRIGASSIGAAQRLFIFVVTVLTPATTETLD
jgi:hypothetical protein